MMKIAVCDVETANVTAIRESPFPNFFPRLFLPFYNGYLFAADSKLFHYNGNDVDNTPIVFENAVTSLAMTDEAIYLVSDEQLWRTDHMLPLDFTLVQIQQSIVQVACGHSHTLVLTKEGEVFARGRGAACGLGLADETEEEEFTKIQGLANVFYIAAGATHSAVVRCIPDKSDAAGRIRPMRLRQALTTEVKRRRQINESFVRGVVMMSREGSKVKQGALAVHDKDPLADLEAKRRLESEVLVFGKDVGLGLGKGVMEKNQPVLLPNREAVVQVACGARHTVALTATGQVLVWGEYFPGRTIHEPTVMQLSSNLYVMEVAAGDRFTMACAYIQNIPKIYVIDENKCWQHRGAVLNVNSNPRLYQGLACHRDDHRGHVLVVERDDEGEKERIEGERQAIHELNYNVLNQVRHLYNLRRQFSLKWKTSPETLEKDNNVVKTFADMLDSILMMVDLGHKLSWHLSKHTCLLQSIAEEEKLADMLREFCDISNFFRCLFNDLLAYECFQSVYDKYKQDMIDVIKGVHGNKLRRGEESKVSKYLTMELEKGTIVFTDLTSDHWQTLRSTDNEALTAVIDELDQKEEELLRDMSEAVENAGKVNIHLSVVRTEFFAPKRRIRLISSNSSRVQVTGCGDIARPRDILIVLTGEELVILANRKLYMWNYQAVWLDKYSETDLTVDIILPETRFTLKANLLTVLDKWVSCICAGISQRFGVECTIQDCISNRTFKYKFIMLKRMGTVYHGDWEKGQMHGNGQYWETQKDGKEKIRVVYTGDFVHNERCGYGKRIKDWPNGRSEIVVGAWDKDELHGYAEKLITKSTIRNSLDEDEEPLMHYEGCFVKRLRHGLGRLEEWVDDQKLIYLGNWVGDKRHGYGIQSIGNRAFFGEFKADKETELGYSINYCSGDIVSTTWINGSNFRYHRKDDGQCELMYKIGGFDVLLTGRISREPCEGKWSIRDGTFSVATKKNFPYLFGDTVIEVSEKWRVLVEECKKMLIGDSCCTTEENVIVNPWMEYLPSKLRGENEDKRQSLQRYFERFTALHTTGDAEENPVTEEDWCLMKEFAVQIQINYPSFALSYFLKRRTEVFTFFVGVNNHDLLEKLVLQELEELIQDTYVLLRCLFPRLPNQPKKRATKMPRSSGYDLVLAILPLTFYQELMTIFSAFTTTAKRNFMNFCKKPMSDKDFLTQECCFPSQSRKLVQGILDDLESRSPPRSPRDIDVSMPLRRGSTVANEVHVADIIEKVSSTFSATKTIDVEEAFRMLGIVEEIYESSSQFINRIYGNFGADEMNPFLYFILWKARPSNLDLHIFLVRHLTKHYEHYHQFGRWDYALTTFSAVFEVMCTPPNA